MFEHGRRDVRGGEPRPGRGGYRLAVAACVAALVASLLLFVVPARTVETASSPNGQTRVRTEPALDDLTTGAALIVAMPVAVSAVPLVFRRRRRGALLTRALSAGTLYLWTLLSGWLFYLLAALLMLVAFAVEVGQAPGSAGADVDR